MRKDRAKELRRAAQLSAQSATDAQAQALASLYPAWSPGAAYGGDGEPQIVSRPKGLYRVRTAHTSQTGWEPEGNAALWAYIDQEHAGTLDDPIPAVVNMAYFQGKYYAEDGALYLCVRDSEIPLAYLPSQLVGTYFEAVV